MQLLLLLALLVLSFVLARQARRFFARRESAARSRRRLVETLSDPRDAAAILLVQQAAYEGHVSLDHKRVITALMRKAFGSDEAEAEGLFSFGRMAIGQTGDAADALPRLLRPIRERCTLDEMKELLAMLEEVASTQAPPNDKQRALIVATRRALRLGEPADKTA
ncbi:hypothetical protein [Parvularcula oceani]|uniref:hypothetical protein n=1 Tax=Parvularcula oceani TaxID=1247963 RepID=UPI0004E2138D|nr:hypothetical protein [Parvularcula oceani]